MISSTARRAMAGRQCVAAAFPRRGMLAAVATGALMLQGSRAMVAVAAAEGFTMASNGLSFKDTLVGSGPAPVKGQSKIGNAHAGASGTAAS